MKYTFAFFLFLGAICMSAQETYTDKLQQATESTGKIVLHQDKAITDLVNGAKKKSAESTAAPVRQKPLDGVIDSTAEADKFSLESRVKVNGYRIQVYFGDNSRQGKSGARAAGQRFKSYFPYQSVYVSFVSPHWLCRAGDFRTMEEAREILSQIRTMGIFREAVIVKSKVNVRL